MHFQQEQTHLSDPRECDTVPDPHTDSVLLKRDFEKLKESNSRKTSFVHLQVCCSASWETPPACKGLCLRDQDSLGKDVWRN
ncbi:hypothetical protein R3I94_016704 [Phoxinus phoxinus]